ncbi:MAG: alpha/beta hydrolase [Vicinamibacterales bacterium]
MNSVIQRNQVTVSGRAQGKTVVFAHGFGCDQRLWRWVAPAFEDRYRVVVFDFVGSGRSDIEAYSRTRYAALDGYAQDVVEVIEAVGGDPVVFVGHSVSATTGVLAAIQRPELFSHLALVSPSPCYLNHPPDYRGGFERAEIEGLLDLMDKNPAGWAGFLAPLVMANPERPELETELRESFCTMDPRVARQFAEVTFFSDNRRDLGRLQKPTLILQCREDAVASPEVGQFVHQQIDGSRLVTLEAWGHCPHVSHPQETTAALREYLRSEGLE